MAREEEMWKAVEEEHGTLTPREAFVSLTAMKWADKTMLEKACEWLENIDFASEYFYDGEGFFENAILVEEFKKAMEE